MRTLQLKLFFGIAFTFLAASTAARQAADLRPKFEKGQESKYRMEIDSNSVTESPDPDADAAADPAAKNPKPGTKAEPKGLGTIKATQKMTQSLGLRFKVVNVDAQKNATVELIYDSLKVSIDGPEGKGNFDSSKPPSKPAGKPAGKKPDDPQTLNIDPLDSGDPTANLGSIVGSVLTLTIDKDGNITRVSGGEGLVPTVPGDPARSLVTPGGVKELWGPIFTMRKATGTASVGERWKTTDTTDMSPIGRFSITTESVLKSLTGGMANVEFKGIIAPAVESSAGLMGFQVKDSTHEGSYRWDTQRGILGSLDMTQVVEIEGGGQGFKLNSKSTTRTSIKRVE